MSTKADYIKLISEVDKLLSILRGFWMDARSNDDKRKYHDRLNQSLEERSRLMKLRDEVKT